MLTLLVLLGFYPAATGRWIMHTGGGHLMGYTEGVVLQKDNRIALCNSRLA